MADTWEKVNPCRIKPIRIINTHTHTHVLIYKDMKIVYCTIYETEYDR